MSWWTYVNGMLEVYVSGRTQAECDYILQTVLDHLPKVSGSEQEMEVYVNRRYGCNTSSSVDEFCLPTNLGKGSDGYFEYQTQYILTVKGSLRDTRFKETLKRFNKWLLRLGSRLEIDNILVSVRGFDQEYIFANNVLDIYNSDCQSKYHWTNYLRWKDVTDKQGRVYCVKPDTPDGKCDALELSDGRKE